MTFTTRRHLVSPFAIQLAFSSVAVASHSTHNLTLKFWVFSALSNVRPPQSSALPPKPLGIDGNRRAMRLLNVKTKKLEEFFDKSIPKYAILSHTWDDDEVTFRDFDPVLSPQRTSAKIDGCCAQTPKDGFDYVWIDTCCIDKSSSAELSEAINSMFRWYKKSTVCYVYLSGVMSDQVDYHDKNSDVRRSRWFTRGWTLQELLAPRDLLFYNSSWYLLGQVDKVRSSNKLTPWTYLFLLVSEITGIPGHYVAEADLLSTASITTKMSWASSRQTTRVEDIAYCLFGIFDVAMPMLYGEGMKAFIRLQEEIMKNDDDQLIFAWGYRSPSGASETRALSYFARSPAKFEHYRHLKAYTAGTKLSHYVATNTGLYIEMSFLQLVTRHCIELINCKEPARYLREDAGCLAIP